MFRETITSVCVHGDEQFGLKLSNKVNHILISNPQAVKLNKRFVEEDLNRSFNKKGNSFEIKLARVLLKKFKGYNLVDIHTTTADMKEFGIVTKANNYKIKLCKKLGLKKVVIMGDEVASGHSFIDNVENGISIEIGEKYCNDNLAKNLAKRINNLDKNSDPIIYQSFNKLEGKFDKLYMENFKQVKVGDLIYEYKGKKHYADRDFIPLFIGEKHYDYICVMARRVLWK